MKLRSIVKEEALPIDPMLSTGDEIDNEQLMNNMQHQEDDKQEELKKQTQQILAPQFKSIDNSLNTMSKEIVNGQTNNLGAATNLNSLDVEVNKVNNLLQNVRNTI